MKRTIFIIILAFVAIGAVIGWRLYTKPVEGFDTTTPSHVMTSSELYAAFSDDEAAATTKYANEVVQVEGMVVDRIENSDGGYTLILEGGHPIFGVKCRLDPEVPESSMPDKRASTTLKGLCVGMNSDVELDRCIIVSSQKP